MFSNDSHPYPMQTSSLIRQSILLAALGFTFTSAFADPLPTPPPVESPVAQVIAVGDRDLQSVLDDAPPFSTVDAGAREIVVEEGRTIQIKKPVRLVRLHARLAPGAARTELIRVNAEHVIIEDFRLVGNHPTVPQDRRASLLRVAASHFRIENGTVLDATRHGVHVEPDGDQLKHGVVRGIFGRGNQRDTVSIAGQGHRGWYNWHILVENIVSHDSALKGGVEICDGNRFVTVRNVYAKGGQYAVDVQDHQEPGQTNHHILIDGVQAENVQVAVTTNARPLGHRNLTVRNVTGTAWGPRRGQRARVDIIHFDHVTLENIRVLDNPAGPSIGVRWSRGVFARDLLVENAVDTTAAAVQWIDVNEAILDGAIVRGDSGKAPAFHYHLTGRHGNGSHLIVRNLIAPTTLPIGILLDRADPGVSLEHYQVAGNFALVDNRFENAVIPQ